MVKPLVSKEAELNADLVTYGKLTWTYIEKPGDQDVEYLP